MKVIISGGTGMIGWALAQDLVRDGHEAVLLTRKANHVHTLPRGIRLLQWNGKSAGDWAKELESTDAVVNLAGENLSARRWTNQQKEKIIASRVNAGRALSEAIEKTNHKPAVLIQASGVGAYGTSEDRVFAETDAYGSDYLASVTKVWEASTQSIERLGIRRVIVRSGVVFSKGKGALKLMLLPFRLFVGGVIGSGRQWIPWIHLKDEVRAIRFLMENEKAQGVFNLSAEPVTNKQFAKSAGKALHRPSWFPMPGFVLQLVLGEMSMMVLDGQKVSANKILDLGYQFIYPKIDEALNAIV